MAHQKKKREKRGKQEEEGEEGSKSVCAKTLTDEACVTRC